MNCEKCKNKGATVFYADDGGGRHALCASCAAMLGKSGQYSPRASEVERGTTFIPEPHLYSLICARSELPIYLSATDTSSPASQKCSFCGTELETVRQSGEVGCAVCYSVFAPFILPSTLTPESAEGARMPSRRRAAIERQRAIGNMRNKLRLAVETENYELAASLRDKIRELELHK